RRNSANNVELSRLEQPEIVTKFSMEIAGVPYIGADLRRRRSRRRWVTRDGLGPRSRSPCWAPGFRRLSPWANFGIFISALCERVRARSAGQSWRGRAEQG